MELPINLEGLGDSDLQDLLEMEATPKQYREFIIVHLAARQLREMGSVGRAMSLEKVCDSMFASMPEKYQW